MPARKLTLSYRTRFGNVITRRVIQRLWGLDQTFVTVDGEAKLMLRVSDNNVLLIGSTYFFNAETRQWESRDIHYRRPAYLLGTLA